MAGEDLRAACWLEFAALVARYDHSEGWIEYLLWETLEGKRDRPFKLLGPLSDEEKDALRVMRDELEIWGYWNGSAWCEVPVGEWREHAKTVNIDAVIAASHDAHWGT